MSLCKWVYWNGTGFLSPPPLPTTPRNMLQLKSFDCSRRKRPSHDLNYYLSSCNILQSLKAQNTRVPNTEIQNIYKSFLFPCPWNLRFLSANYLKTFSSSSSHTKQTRCQDDMLFSFFYFHACVLMEPRNWQKTVKDYQRDQKYSWLHQ